MQKVAKCFEHQEAEIRSRMDAGEICVICAEGAKTFRHPVLSCDGEGCPLSAADVNIPRQKTYYQSSCGAFLFCTVSLVL